jgi:uncharacterized protein (TIGR02246 family)
MTRNAVERELLALEKKYWQSLKDRDSAVATRLTDDPCLVTGAQGVESLSKEAVGSMVSAAPYRLIDFKIADDAQVRMLSDDVAVLAYNVHEELTVDGEPVTVDAADASTWVRRDGQWLCALHTESLKGDPFGRDRTTTM